MLEGGEGGEKSVKIYQREWRKGRRPVKMCHRKGREQRRRGKLSCGKRRKKHQLYLERELWSQLEVLKKKSS